MLRYRFRTSRAPASTHSFMTTTGLIAVVLVGPVRGLWLLEVS